jgi:hypothetical protein
LLALRAGNGATEDNQRAVILSWVAFIPLPNYRIKNTSGWP